MEIKTIKMSEKGQIAIPKLIREKIGLDKGDELLLFEVDGKIMLEKIKAFSNLIKDNFKDIEKFNEDSLKEVWDNKEDDIWSSYLRK